MYIPRPWHNFFPFALLMLGLYVGHNLKPTYDVVLFCIANYSFALMHAYYITQAGIIYQKYLAQIDTRPEQRPEPMQEKQQSSRKPEPDLGGGFIPLVRLQEKQVYPQVVDTVKFNKERSFAVTLIRMHEYDPVSVDMTEAKWVKTKKFIRAEFVSMLDNWNRHGVIVRASDKKNAPYRVERWEAVRLIANGNPLPPPPR